MTAGAGFSLDAIKKARQNRSLRNSQKNKFKGGVDRSLASNEKKKTTYKEVSEEELAKIKAKIKADAKREKRKNALILGVLSAIILLTLFLL